MGLLLFLLHSGVWAQTEQVITSSPGQDRHPWWSPDGSQLVFESDRDGDWELFITNRDGTSERQITHNSANDRNPSWHPNGTGLLFESDRSGKTKLYHLDLTSGNVEEIKLDGFGLSPTTARYSPEGQQIVFCANTGAENELQLNLFLVPAQGGKPQQLTAGNRRSFYPSWSANGDQLVFHSRRDTQGKQDEIYIMDVSKGDESSQRITTYPLHDFCPHWSPDGQWLVFSSSIKEARPDLFISKTDGTATRQLTFTPTLGETQAVWSPDGKTIAFAGFRKGSYEICLINID